MGLFWAGVAVCLGALVFVRFVVGVVQFVYGELIKPKRDKEKAWRQEVNDMLVEWHASKLKG